MSAVGRRIDRYVIEAELDSGGFGTVYRARHTVIGRAVALKLLHPSHEASLGVVERFLREARIVAALSSPHVVQVLDAGMTDDRQLFLAMELLEGETLGARMSRTGPLVPRDAVTIARQILAGLVAAHAAGVVHRDLKPANVFIARTPDHREVAKVLDFGISKSRASGDDDVITMTGAVLGTPHYMAPEQLQGARDVDARADLFAVAVVLYEMLSGRLPYESNTLEGLIAKRLVDPPTPLESIVRHLPPKLLAIVDRGLARDPDARFRTAGELDAALGAIDVPGGLAPLTGPMPPTTPPQRVIVSSRPGPGEPSVSIGMAQTYATPGSVRPAGSAGAVASRPVGAVTTGGGHGGSRTMAPGTTTFPARGLGIGVLALLLGVAGLVILVLAGALAGITTAFVMRDEPPAPQAPPQYPSAPITVSPGTPVVIAGPDPGGWAADPFGGAAPPPVAPVAPVAPAAGDGPLRAYVDHVLGSVDGAALSSLIDRAMPQIDRCRRNVDDDVRVQLFANPGGSIPMAQPDVNMAHGDDATARCVASALQGAAPLSDPNAQGIVIVLAHLPARR